MARVDRRRRHHPRGRRRPHRPRRARGRARPPRRPAAEDRLVLGRLERHRASSPTPAPSPTCCTGTARSPSGTTPPPRRTSTSTMNPPCPERPARLQGRRVPRPAQVRRRPGHARGARRPARAARATACPTSSGGGTVAYVNPVEHRYLADPEHREEGGTPAIVESIRAGLVFQLKEAVGCRGDPGPARSAFVRRALAPGQRNPRSRSSATSTPSGSRSSPSSSARPGGRVPPPQLRRRGAQRSVRDPGARRLLLRRARTATGCSASTSTARTSSSARSPAAARGSSRAGPGSASTTSSPRRCSTTSSRPST